MVYRKVSFPRSITIINTVYKIPDLELAIHSAESDRIVLWYPGAGTEIDAHEEFGDAAQKEGHAFVRTDNVPQCKPLYRHFVRDNLSYAIEQCKGLAGIICESDDPKISLAGISAGASAIAAVGHQFPEVDRMLLVNPSGDAGKEHIEEGLRKYNGALYVALGKNDDVISPSTGCRYFDIASTKKKHIVTLTGRGHLFDDEDLLSCLNWAFRDGRKPS